MKIGWITNSIRLASLIFLLNFSSCTNEKKFKIDIPQNSDKKNSTVNGLKSIKDSLSVDVLENGFDSLEIRIWFSYGLSYDQEVIIVKNSNFEWKCIYGKFAPVFFEYRTDSLLFFKKNFVEKRPKIPWNDLMSLIYDNQIFSLPDYTKIKNYMTGHDGDTVVIEIAIKELYRLIRYPMPSIAGCDEAEKIRKIVDLFFVRNLI